MVTAAHLVVVALQLLLLQQLLLPLRLQQRVLLAVAPVPLQAQHPKQLTQLMQTPQPQPQQWHRLQQRPPKHLIVQQVDQKAQSFGHSELLNLYMVLAM
jgi:hypothetical protein